MVVCCEVEVVKQTDEWKGGADSDGEQVRSEFLWSCSEESKNCSKWMYITIGST